VQSIESKKPDRSTRSLRPLRGKVDRGGTDIAAFDLHPYPGTTGLVADSNGDIAAAGCDIEDAHGPFQPLRQPS
jgi:hypothetical protein